MGKIVFVTIVMVMVLLQSIHAEFAYFDYVQEPTNPRLVALGSAGTALASGGFAYYNPAGAAFADRSFIALDFGRQWGDLSRGSVESAWIFEKWFIGGTFLGRTIDYPLADETGMLPGPGSEQASMFSLFTGIKKSRYAIGIAGNALPHFIGGENAFAMSASAGVSGVIIPDRLTVGAAVLQAGRLHRGFYSSSFSAHRDSMATTVRAGAALCDTIMETLPVLLTVDGVYEKGENRVLIPVGIEFRPVPPIALRVGKRFNHLTDKVSFGIGLSWDNVAFDAAFVSTDFEGTSEMKWLMGIKYALPGTLRSPKKNIITADTALITPAADPAEENSAPMPAVNTPGTVGAALLMVDTVVTSDSTTVAPANNRADVQGETAPLKLLPALPVDSSQVPDTTSGITPTTSEPVPTPAALLTNDGAATATTTPESPVLSTDNTARPAVKAPVDSLKKEASHE